MHPKTLRERLHQGIADLQATNPHSRHLPTMRNALAALRGQDEVIKALRDELIDIKSRRADPLGPLAVVMDGGVIQSFCSDDSRLFGAQVLVIDYDTADASLEDREVFEVEQITGDDSRHTVGACCHLDRVNIAAGIDIATTLERIAAREEIQSQGGLGTMIARAKLPEAQ